MSGTKNPEGFTVTLAAVPNADFNPGSHEREVSVDTHEVQVDSLAEARHAVLVFVHEHDLGGGNVPTARGVVRKGGVPVGRVSIGGRIWATGADGKETDVQITSELLADPKPATPAPAAPRTLGSIVRLLRQAAALSRRAFGDAVALGEPVLKSFEVGRSMLTPEELRRLLAHPAMADLPVLAAKAGLALDPGDTGVKQP